MDCLFWENILKLWKILLSGNTNMSLYLWIYWPVKGQVFELAMTQNKKFKILIISRMKNWSIYFIHQCDKATTFFLVVESSEKYSSLPVLKNCVLRLNLTVLALGESLILHCLYQYLPLKIFSGLLISNLARDSSNILFF